MYGTLCGAPQKPTSGSGKINVPGDKEFWQEIEKKYVP
jgi:hypothetical protein